VSGIHAALQLENASESQLAVSDATPEETSFVVEETTVLPVLPNESVESSFVVEFITDPVPELQTVLSLDKPLRNYPNPFSFAKGHTTVGYSLTKDADIKLEIYSLMGYKLYSDSFASGTPGGSSGYNRIRLDKMELSPAKLSPGVYLYILESDGELLAKNRMVVTP
jgi:hypothetical protein